MEICLDQRECEQCGVLTYPHHQCRCRICGQIHKHIPGCRPVACDQCGNTASPHRSCLCRQCGKRHSKLSGCRINTTSSLQRLPSDRQAIMLASRSNCPQCRMYSAPHSRCRCHACGLLHDKLRGCRAPQSNFAVVSAAPAVVVLPDTACEQCGIVSFPHSYCHCLRCDTVHNKSRICSAAALWRRAAVRGVTPEVHDAGNMDVDCLSCGARRWSDEKISCCASGNLVLPAFPDVPPALSAAILAPHVRQNIRAYNMALSMASVGHSNISLPDGTFVLGGKTYHRVGSMLPSPGTPHSFAQIYVLDVEQATDRRVAVMGGSTSCLRRDLLEALHNQLLAHNPWIRQFVAAAHSDAVQLVWRCTDDLSSMQIGALVAEPGNRRDIVVRRQDGQVQFLHDGHALYHPLAYPLLFPLGTAGWHEGMQTANQDFSQIREITLTEWAR
jgi:hypothetical protein